MENKKTSDGALEQKTLAGSFLRMALPSNKMDLSSGVWLPAPEPGERFDDWTRRAGKELAQTAASIRAQGGRWRVGATIKSMGEAALAATCGYALSAAVIWRLKATNGDALDVEIPIRGASWCGEFFFDIKKSTRIDKAIDAALSGDGMPARREVINFNHSSGVKEFSEAALAIALGVVAAPIGWGGLAIAQHPLRQRGLTLAADALDKAAKMMSSSEGVKGFGPREMAVAGWLRACRVAKSFGANAAPAMMAALACRAQSLPGEPLEAIPDVDADWIDSDRGDGPVPKRSEADLAKALAEHFARLSGGEAEARMATTALWTLRSNAGKLEGSEDTRATCASLAVWWKDAQEQCIPQNQSLAPALSEVFLTSWLGLENHERVVSSSRAKSFDDLNEPEGEPLGSEKLAGWAVAMRAMQDEQSWPEAMRRQVSQDLVGIATFLERPRKEPEALAEVEADKKVDAILEDIGARFTEAAAPLGLSAKEMAASVGEALAKSQPWSKKIASAKNFPKWGWGGIMANAEPIFNKLKVDWEAEQIKEALSSAPTPQKKPSRTRL